MNEGVVLEEDENLKNEENQTDFDPNDCSSPKIHPPNILETADKINDDNHSAKDDFVYVVEETLVNCEKCSLHEDKLNEIGDGDDEAKVSSFNEDEKGNNFVIMIIIIIRGKSK